MIVDILVWVFLIAGLSSVISAAVDENSWQTVLSIVVLILGFWLAIGVHNHAYKLGQVDAINGDFKYEMKVNADTVYVEK